MNTGTVHHAAKGHHFPYVPVSTEEKMLTATQNSQFLPQSPVGAQWFAHPWRDDQAQRAPALYPPKVTGGFKV